MFFKLLVIFIVVPVVELSLLIKVGSIIGTLNTIIIVLLTAAIGAYMVKLEGLGVMYRIQKNLMEGIFPAEELIDGVMILIAGVLLLTPGFITDIIGFLMVFPGSRNVIKRLARRYFDRRITSVHIR
ncbi:phage T7 F exclusion suppressor FxsA [bacterium BMS3Bbin07]|uniref:FxsA protein n=2 Tax=hydrothermal vent metagenome TaxID=652676 RepID=A0A3B1DGB9_9ZZZZ|nr:FxsA family protein [Nitrospirota bacterium]GBE37059.1 phage T7 F exclusion suppressor FxsA [bacterium BMS3Bbin07]HDH02549.1 FxsA family protein [Nitrospirota bacterium]